MLSEGLRLKLKYCWQIAAAFGKVCRTKGDAASLCSRVLVPDSESKAILDHDIAKSLAGPVRRLNSLLAQYLRLCAGVEVTHQATSRVYLRHVRADPSHEGTADRSETSAIVWKIDLKLTLKEKREKTAVRQAGTVQVERESQAVGTRAFTKTKSLSEQPNLTTL